MRWLVGVDDWLASYGKEIIEITELDPISTEERLRQLCAVYGYNGTEFSYVFYNGRTAKRQRKNGNGMVETRHNAWFPPFRCRSSVAISLFPLAVAVSA